MSDINLQDLQELAGLAGPGGQAVTLPASPARFTPVAEDDTENERESVLAEEMRLDREFRQQQAVMQTEQRRQDARQTLARVLETYGLAELADYTYNEIIVKETVNINNPDAVVFALREQPAYQKRFSGNAARLRAGLPELDPASYIQLENTYRQTLRDNGLPAQFYNEPDDFRALIEGDVSPAELNERVQQGYRAVADADPEVKRQMQQLYGVTEGELVAYFLDPQRTAPLLTRQARAAQIAARGAEQAGIQVMGALAENLAARGVTAEEAQRGFAEIGALGELRQTFAGEQDLTQEQIVGAQFGADTAAAEELKRRQRQRVAAFQGGGGFARTTGATSGTIRTSVGQAE